MKFGLCYDIEMATRSRELFAKAVMPALRHLGE